jgi:hypothetical protein
MNSSADFESGVSSQPAIRRVNTECIHGTHIDCDIIERYNCDHWQVNALVHSQVCSSAVSFQQGVMLAGGAFSRRSDWSGV